MGRVHRLAFGCDALLLLWRGQRPKTFAEVIHIPVTCISELFTPRFAPFRGLLGPERNLPVDFELDLGSAGGSLGRPRRGAFDLKVVEPCTM